MGAMVGIGKCAFLVGYKIQSPEVTGGPARSVVVIGGIDVPVRAWRTMFVSKAPTVRPTSITPRSVQAAGTASASSWRVAS